MKYYNHNFQYEPNQSPYSPESAGPSAGAREKDHETALLESGKSTDDLGREMAADAHHDGDMKGPNTEVRYIPLSDIYETGDMKRSLSPEDYEQLKSNLASNRLINPIIVRPRAEGGYQLVSGHNRVQAYRDLGRVDIEAIIRDFADTEIVETAFYSNLISSPLSDYEKYLGFKKIQSLTGETQSQLSARAGVSQTQMSQIFSFSHLSTEAHELLKSNPGVLGYNTMAKMKPFDPKNVTEAIRLLVTGEISTEKEALALLVTRPARPQANVIEFRSGKKLFAKVTQRDNIIAIDFKNKNNIDGFQAELTDLLNKYAEL